MWVLKCDRCKKEMPINDDKFFVVELRGRRGLETLPIQDDKERLEICPSCKEDFERFLKGEGNV